MCLHISRLEKYKHYFRLLSLLDGEKQIYAHKKKRVVRTKKKKRAQKEEEEEEEETYNNIIFITFITIITWPLITKAAWGP